MFNLFEDHIDVPMGAKVTSKNGYNRQRMIQVKIFGRFATSAIVKIPEAPQTTRKRHRL